jgi:hypothetical protein
MKPPFCAKTVKGFARRGALFTRALHVLHATPVYTLRVKNCTLHANPCLHRRLHVTRKFLLTRVSANPFLGLDKCRRFRGFGRGARIKILRELSYGNLSAYNRTDWACLGSQGTKSQVPPGPKSGGLACFDSLNLNLFKGYFTHVSISI